jgi:hypothetical protein
MPLTVRGFRYLAVVALLGVLGLSACTANSSDDVITARPPDPALKGRFFASAGEGESTRDVYEMQFNPLRLYRRSATGRAFTMGGCATDLIVTVADKSVGYRDELRSFSDDKFLPIEGLTDPSGALPAVATDCRLLFNRLDKSSDPPTNRLLVFDPASRTTTELRTAAFADNKTLGVPVWGPAGQVAVFEGTMAKPGLPGVATGIAVISPDGSARTLDPPVPDFGTLAWAPSQWMAIANLDKGTVFLNPGTGEKQELPGWLPLTWSPDGMRLLVADAKQRKTIGLVELPELSSVRKLGTTSEMAVFDVVWLPPDATAVGPDTVGRRPDDGDEG